MGQVRIGIKDSHVYYTHVSKVGALNNAGHVSINHDLNTLATANPADAIYWTNSIPLTTDQFIRFKNGGKRLPTNMVKTPGGKFVGKKLKVRTRANRTNDFVRFRDVGPYSTGQGNLNRPAAVANLERDHMNSAGALQYRTNVLNQGILAGQGFSANQVSARGVAMAIDRATHKAGFSHGGKQQLTDTPTGQTRLQWAAHNPADALYREMEDELAYLYGTGQLTFEWVGSYRYLYRLNVKSGFIPAADALDALVEAYLAVAV